jgi:hypothetical protein
MSANTLVKGKIPDWVADMFKKVDGKDIKGASAYFSDNCDFYFGHFLTKPGPQGALSFMGAFDAQFSEYHHLIDEVWAGPELVEFGGRVQFKIDDGTVVETPFYNRFFIESSSGQPKIVKAYALVDLAALPAKYWEHMSALARPS